jgi:hypothetical protein
MERLCCLALFSLLLATTAKGDDLQPTSVAALFAGYSESLSSASGIPEPTGEPLMASSDGMPSGMVDACGPACAELAMPVRRRWWHPYGGFEFGWLQPRFSDNVAALITRPAGNLVLPFDHDYELSPRVWVGLENGRCTGLRARYWDLDIDAPTLVTFPAVGATPVSLTVYSADGNLSRTATANVGDAMTSRHHLEMQTIDLEGTQRVDFGRTQLLGSFGLRYAETLQRSRGVVTDGTGAMTELVCQCVRWEGFGPTAALEITRQLFPCHSILQRLSFFSDFRGSILLGENREQIVLVTGGGATLIEDIYEHDDVIPIAEMVGGLQLLTQPCGRACWTLRTGYRAETWFAAGGPVDSESNLGLHGMILSIAAWY